MRNSHGSAFTASESMFPSGSLAEREIYVELSRGAYPSDRFSIAPSCEPLLVDRGMSVQGHRKTLGRPRWSAKCEPIAKMWV